MNVINGASYAGNPVSHTAMYITKKVEHLVENLRSVSGCLVFIEQNVIVPEDISQKHQFVRTDNPQGDYAAYVNGIYKERLQAEKAKAYTRVNGMYTIGENVKIGPNAYIEPGVFIGHDVIIGDNAVIKANAIIKQAVIGDNFIACEGCTIGMFGFTMAKDTCGNNVRIPTLGKVQIGNNVEVGTNTNISCGSSGDTIIEDNVKIDTLVHVAHDVHIHKNTEIPAGVILGGYSDIGENVFIGINSAVRNRKTVGDNAYIGMGTVVTKNVEAGTTVVGNPVRKLEKKG